MAHEFKPAEFHAREIFFAKTGMPLVENWPSIMTSLHVSRNMLPWCVPDFIPKGNIALPKL